MVAGVRLGMCLIASTVLSLVAPEVARAAPAQQVSPDGVVYTFGTGASGEAVLTFDVGELHVEKSVSANGTTALSIRAGVEDVRIELSEGRVTVSSADGKASFDPNGPDEAGQASVRVALARSRAVQVFRAFAARANARARKTAFDEAVALSGAMIGRLAGDPGALRGFSDRHRPTKGGVRAISLRRTTDCWGQYETYILWAWGQYEQCITSYFALIRGLSYCEFQYYMRAESAWFQFLSCSAIPIT